MQKRIITILAAVACAALTACGTAKSEEKKTEDAPAAAPVAEHPAGTEHPAGAEHPAATDAPAPAEQPK